MRSFQIALSHFFEEVHMAKVRKQTSPFEQSFMFHMIRDFFLLLVLVATVEMSIRYALVRYDFASKEQGRVDQAAQQLANDVKSIMLNSGGPLLTNIKAFEPTHKH